MNILSIDWDFFFPDVMQFDWGHRESSLFIETIWPLRAGNVSLTTGKRAVDFVRPDESLLQDFWERVVYSPEMVSTLVITESHSDIRQILKFFKHKVVVNFDQHHDLMYGKAIPKNDPDCGSWAGWGINNRHIKEYHLFYPEWRKGNKEEIPELPTRAKYRFAMNYGLDCNFLPHFFDIVFICRSGAWTPSWCDDRFFEFVSWWERFDTTWECKTVLPYVMQARQPDLTNALKLADEYVLQMAKLMGGAR